MKKIITFSLLTSVLFSFVAQAEVPMPDPIKNDQTLRGIDSDNDGLRDDIQIWIDQTYNKNQTIKFGVMQVSRALQANLLHAFDKKLSNEATQKYLDSSLCLSALVGIDEKIKILAEIENRTLNTKERLYANKRNDEHFSGEMYVLKGDLATQKTLCAFPVK